MKIFTSITALYMYGEYMACIDMNENVVTRKFFNTKKLQMKLMRITVLVLELYAWGGLDTVEQI